MISDNEELMTLQEYISKEEELEAEARDVLPGKFDSCTYKMGYINQSVYVCRTCVVDNRPAAVCYACSIECHSSCELIELMRKRDIRCDCGNACFSTTCMLEPGKDALNTMNKYEPLQNFYGNFCSCKKYSEEEEEQTMYQCLSCQDWFHEGCIAGPPDPDTFSDLICEKCPKHVLRQVLSCESSKTHLGLSANDSPWFLAKNYRESICKCYDCVLLLKDYRHFAEEPVFWEPEPDDGKSPLTDALLQNRQLLDKGTLAMGKLKDKLSSFLKSHPKDIVRKEDIQRFFRSL